MRIVILGKTGAGKSSLANTTFGEDVFRVYDSSNSGTRECKAVTNTINGRNITLIDTPGLFDTNRSEEEMKPAILKCLMECAPGPHAFLIVLKVEKFTEQEKAVIDKISKHFGEKVFRYSTIVFTHGDQLSDGKTIKDFVYQNELMRDLVKKCGDRCHVIDNKYWKDKPQGEYRSNKFQVAQLLNTIDKMVENNGGYYTNEMLQRVKEIKQQEGENIRQSSPNMTKEEIREQAKVSVFRRMWSKVGNIGVSFLGGLFGVAASVARILFK
uniref:GTPase IMAP family member 7-like n=1 Tax=Monopterus albus TaxID=43700 RepID=UPI0009B452AE|nr:GTPase IMAP family member 7-like [Monopterus albus]